jgi:hypothetical protein
MERGEAERMEADYSVAYADFSARHAASGPLVAALTQVWGHAGVGVGYAHTRIVCWWWWWSGPPGCPSARPESSQRACLGPAGLRG